MIRHRLTTGAMTLAFALSLSPVALAKQAGSRPNPNGGGGGSSGGGGGSSSGSAVPRGGGGDSGGGSTSSSAGSRSSGSSSGSSSDSSSWSSSPSRATARAPERPRSENSGGERGPSRSAGSSSVSRGSATSNASGDNDQATTQRTAVPAYSRPRDGRSVQGSATERVGGVPTHPIYVPVYYDPYYSFYYGYGGGYYGSCAYSYYGCGYYGYSPYFFPGYGFGLGYMSDPFGYGGGGDPYQGGYSASTQYRETGSLRLKIKPNHAQVYIDGYYVGVVDSFDGAFQKLGIDAGTHKIEIRAEGYQTVTFEVVVTPGETATYKGELKRQ